jgi:hypothetical protein
MEIDETQRVPETIPELELNTDTNSAIKNSFTAGKDLNTIMKDRVLRWIERDESVKAWVKSGDFLEQSAIEWMEALKKELKDSMVRPEAQDWESRTLYLENLKNLVAERHTALVDGVETKFPSDVDTSSRKRVNAKILDWLENDASVKGWLKDGRNLDYDRSWAHWVSQSLEQNSIRMVESLPKGLKSQVTKGPKQYGHFLYPRNMGVF